MRASKSPSPRQRDPKKKRKNNLVEDVAFCYEHSLKKGGL